MGKQRMRPVTIEWCLPDSETVKDLGIECFNKIEVNGNEYYWRWV